MGAPEGSESRSAQRVRGSRDHIWPLSADVVICTYDLSRFNAEIVIDAIRTHPVVIIGGVLQENPFYVHPGAAAAVEELRLASPERWNGCRDGLLAYLRRSVGDDAAGWPPLLRYVVEDTHLSILPLRLGLDSQLGVLVVGSCRVDFPGSAEKLVLNVAANQAAIGLREASRIRALTASIVHEVNQPLSGVVTNASTCLRMLNADPPNLDGARETIRRTVRDGNRASETIAKLRALFTRKETTIEALDLSEVAREALAMSQSDIEQRRALLHAELAADLPRICGDRIQLQQVIVNLLRNATEAMADIDGRPRRLAVRTACDRSGFVRLSVQDAGIGFGARDAEKLFEMFYTTKHGGMGIGLSVSRSIIQRHGGSLWAEPDTDGPGAIFSFSLPIAGDRAAQPRP